MAIANRIRRRICGGNLNGSIMPDFSFSFQMDGGCFFEMTIQQPPYSNLVDSYFFKPRT